jgi:predicted heme/steroid binding protein
MIKKLSLLLFSIILMGGLVACGNNEPEVETFATPAPLVEGEPGIINEDGYLELTIEELAFYDGTDGKRALVVVEGYIYDMTDSDYWRNGAHNGFNAGQDLTVAINVNAPHGPGFLDRVPRVGKIID